VGKVKIIHHGGYGPSGDRFAPASQARQAASQDHA